MKSLGKFIITASIGLASASMGLSEPALLSDTELAEATNLLNSVDTWSEFSALPTSLVWAGSIGSHTGTKFQVELCGYSGCEPWKDVFVTRDSSRIIADMPDVFLTEILSAQPNPFFPRRPELIAALNVLFKNPNAVKEVLKSGNEIVAAIYNKTERAEKFTFVLSAVGPWMPNTESALLVISKGSDGYRWSVIPH